MNTAAGFIAGAAGNIVFYTIALTPDQTGFHSYR